MSAALIHFSENRKVVNALLNYMNDGLMLTNKNKEIIAVNPAFERMTGYTLQDVYGKNPRVLQSGHTPVQTYKNMWQTLHTKGTWTGELCNERKDGDLFWSFITITKVQSEKEGTYYIGMMRDITEQKEREKELELRANYDALTNLPNRNLFEKKVKEVISEAKENRQKVGILFLDIDRFKKINDLYGHHIGDQLLSKIATRLEKVIGTDGLVSRFGGDEFTIYIQSLSSAQDANIIIDRIFNAFEKPFTINDESVYITVSIGLSLYPDHGQKIETLLKNADRAMYQLKDRPRHFQVYDQDMNDVKDEKLSLETDLVVALKKKQLQVYYQLQVDLNKRQPFGVEALVRWDHPTKGLLSPGIFLPIAEESGLMAAVDEFVLLEACKQTKKWHDKGYDFLVTSVNVSKHFFRQDDFVQKVKEATAKAKVDPSALCVEITENTAIYNTDEIREKLVQLKKFGVKVSLDDFGTGYSSLSKIKQFPIDTLKIDQSFVRDIQLAENSKIVTLIIDLAESLGMSVICEGVETEEQLQSIQEKGCTQAQGFLFSRPVAPLECEQLLQNYALDGNS